MPATFVNNAAIARVSRDLASRRDDLGRASRVSVTVGIHEEEGAAEEGAAEEGASTVAQVGLFHEMGTSTIPRRSWLADGISENEAEITEALRRVGRAVAQKTMRVDTAYAQLGEFIVAKLQARIRANIPPPLSPVTVERKGSSTALIDEGRLIDSIRSRVREGSS